MHAEDTICTCYHWYGEHDTTGECLAPNCDCVAFRFSARNSTPAAIADRGGDPGKWPDHAKQALTELLD